MAVFTPLTAQEIRTFLSSHYSLGELLAAEGIAEGIENTNYLLITGPLQKRYILTVFEQRTNPRDLPFFMQLTDWLAVRGIPCPRPVKGRDGNMVYALAGKPAAVIEFMEGGNSYEITPDHLLQVGELMARMHLAAEGFPMTRRNAMSFSGWEELFAQFRYRADEILPGLEKELADELAWLDRHWPSGLPRGVIHADIFPDNVFFAQGDTLRISGVIDFYFACNDFWLYDLLICLNAWCFDKDYAFVKERARALFYAYTRLRPLTSAEHAAMPILARGAAMRFIVTRSYDWLNQPPGALVTPKNPKEYIAKLRFHRQVRHASEYGA